MGRDSARRLPPDLLAIVVWVLLTTLVVFVPLLNESPLRILLALPFVLFVPGYAFVAVLFPEASESPDAGDVIPSAVAKSPLTSPGRSIDSVERVALSFGLSIAIVPLIGIVLNFTPWGIRLVPILLGVSAFTLVMTVVAAARRWWLPEEERFRVSFRDRLTTLRAEVVEPETRTDAVLNAVLVASILLAGGFVAVDVGGPSQPESFTEFYLLTESDSGELVAGGYPSNLTLGESAALVIGIENHEHQTVDYSVIIEFHRVQPGDNSTAVVEKEELQRFRTTLADNETARFEHEVAPTMTGERMRLTYLLYRGDPAPEPTVENAYREVHLWLTVTR